jgi:hypothetical protein
MTERAQRVLGAPLESTSVPTSADENTQYRVGLDTYVLLDEVLNNSIRAIMIYDDFTARFNDADMSALAAVARYNTSLLAINMCGVCVGDASVSLLCDALVRGNVRQIDLSNTYLDDETGASLLALAHCNPRLRTVVVDDTLISEAMMDEIDLVCQFNESSAEELAPVEAIDKQRERYCVHHCFGCCPNGDFCLFSHRSIDVGAGAGRETRGDGRPLQLPEKPSQGASWQGGGGGGGDAEAEGKPLFQMPTLREKLAAAKERKLRGGGGGGGRKKRRQEPLLTPLQWGAVAVLGAAVAVILATSRTRK